MVIKSFDEILDGVKDFILKNTDIIDVEIIDDTTLSRDGGLLIDLPRVGYMPAKEGASPHFMPRQIDIELTLYGKKTNWRSTLSRIEMLEDRLLKSKEYVVNVGSNGGIERAEPEGEFNLQLNIYVPHVTRG